MQIILFLILAGIVIWFVGCVVLCILGAAVQCVLAIPRIIGFVASFAWIFFTSSDGIRYITIGVCIVSIYKRGFAKSLPLLILGIFIFYLVSLSIKKKKRQYLSWIKEQGIGKLTEAPVKSEICEMCKNEVFMLDKSYVMYKQFYNDIVKNIAAQKIIYSSEIENICIHTNSLLIGNKLAILMAHLKRSKLILEVTSPNAESCYLTKTAISDCTALFKNEGGTTVSEFAEMCRNSKAIGNFELNYQELAETILNDIVSQKKAKTVKLPEGTLFIANDLSSSKMKRVEITL